MIADILILTVILAYCAFLVLRRARNKNHPGSGCCGCSGCCGSCSGCMSAPPDQRKERAGK